MIDDRDILAFNTWRRAKNMSIVLPHLPRSVTSLLISEPAKRNVLEIVKDMVITRNEKPGIGSLVEAIGLYQLEVTYPTLHTDKDGLTTDDFAADGYQDAMEGRKPEFALVYGVRDIVFYHAYLRGYFEGFSVRLKKDAK